MNFRHDDEDAKQKEKINDEVSDYFSFNFNKRIVLE